MSTDADKDKLHLPNELPLAQLDTLLAQFRPSPTSSESPPRTASLFSSPGASFSCIFNPESLLTRKLHGFTASSALWCRKAISLLPCSTHHPAALSHDIAAYFQIDISKNRRSTGFERTFEICSPRSKPLFLRSTLLRLLNTRLFAGLYTSTYSEARGGNRPGGDALDILPLRPGPATPISSRHGGW